MFDVATKYQRWNNVETTLSACWEGRCLSDHRWEEGKVSQGLFKGEGVVCIRKGITKTKTSGGPRKVPLYTVSKTILDLHEDSTNLMGSVGVVGLGGLIITGKHCSQLNVYIYFFNLLISMPLSFNEEIRNVWYIFILQSLISIFRDAKWDWLK